MDRGKRQVCIGIRDLLKYCEAFQRMNEESIVRFRKIVRIPSTNVDNFVPSDEKVYSVLRSMEDARYVALYKLLCFSGLRFREAVYMLNTFDSQKLQVNGESAKYPLNLMRGSKRVYYAFMPKTFAEQLRRVGVSEPGVQTYFRRRGMAAKYLRKWHYNFLILHNVPESVADYLQGRAPSTVGSMHYLAKVKQADEWYAKVVPKLLSVLE